MVSIVSDDEEKWFDRISLELLYTAILQQVYPPQSYAEWVVESLSHTTTQKTIIQGLTLIRIECDTQQGDSTSCPFSNIVIFFKKHAFANTPSQQHPPLAPNYAHTLQYLDTRDTLIDIIVHVVSYCDDNTQCTTVLSLF